MYTWGGATNSKLEKRQSILETAVSVGPSDDSPGLKTRIGQQQVLRPLKDRRISQIACGDFHSLALEPSGQLWSWGGGGQAQHNRG